MLDDYIDSLQSKVDCGEHLDPTEGGELIAEVRRLLFHEKLYASALRHVDRVFQDGAFPEPALLPDFCKLGEDKFEAVERLAREVLRLREKNAVLLEACEVAANCDHTHTAEVRTRLESLIEDEERT